MIKTTKEVIAEMVKDKIKKGWSLLKETWNAAPKLGLALVFGAGLLLGTCAAANAGPKFLQDVDDYVVIVGSGCAGVAVGENRILTAYHCVVQNTKKVERDVIGNNGLVEKKTFVIKEPIYVEKLIRDKDRVEVGSIKVRADILTTSDSTMQSYMNQYDVALVELRSPLPGLKTRSIGPLPQLADDVYVVGNPADRINVNTITKGIVSGLAREFPGRGGGTPRYLMQVDAGIWFGNSGGPVFDLDGNVVGIVSMLMLPTGHIGYVVPANVLKEAVEVDFDAAPVVVEEDF